MNFIIQTHRSAAWDPGSCSFYYQTTTAADELLSVTQAETFTEAAVMF